MSAVLAALHQAGACAIEPAPPRFCLIFAGLLSRDYRHATVRPRRATIAAAGFRACSSAV